jgi:hypothetical protein
MGLRQLEWSEGRHGAWVARAVLNNKRYRRVADVNSFDWIDYPTRNKHWGKIPVVFAPAGYGAEPTWHDSIEAAKLYVEAIFALDDY